MKLWCDSDEGCLLERPHRGTRRAAATGDRRRQTGISAPLKDANGLLPVPRPPSLFCSPLNNNTAAHKEKKQQHKCLGVDDEVITVGHRCTFGGENTGKEKKTTMSARRAAERARVKADRLDSIGFVGCE